MSADCKQALAKLARYGGDDPQARKLAKAIVIDHRDVILAAWTTQLPRFIQERTPLGAWRFHVDLDAAWKRWARSVRRDLGLVVDASVANNRLILEVGAQDREHYF